MKILKNLIDWTLIALCAYMVFDGLLIFMVTNGRVQGSEFEMLITLANQLSIVMLWLALFALRRILLQRGEANEQPED